MRKTFFSIIAAAGLIACGQTEEKAVEAQEEPAEEVVAASMYFYGDTITEENAMTVEQFQSAMDGKDSLSVKLTANINETCQVKGCWMTLDMGEGEEMRVKFKDYGFFVPTEGVEGKTTIIEGYAFTDTVSVEMLQHLAEDGGASPEEILAITEPEIGVNFEATGVIIKE